MLGILIYMFLLSSEERLALYEVGLRDLDKKGSTVKSNIRFVYKDMLKLIKSFNKEINNLKEELKSIKTTNESRESPLSFNANLLTSNNSYANVVQNKKKENIVIIKKKEDADDSTDLYKELDNTLMKIKKDVMINKIKRNKFNVIIDTINSESQEKILDEINKSTKINAKKPFIRFPSILIKEISKELDEKEIIKELVENEKINPDKCKIVKLIQNTKFRTNRLLINFDLNETKKILDKGYVKIGYYCCPVEPIFSRCSCCHELNHRLKSKTGEIVCRLAKEDKKKCLSCAETFNSNDSHVCPAKNDKKKLKCVLCNGNHHARSNECPRFNTLLQNFRSTC